MFLAGPFLGAAVGWVIYKFVVEGETEPIGGEVEDSDA